MLEELEYDHTVHSSREADKNLAVRFYLHPLQNAEKSEAEHRPIFDDVEFIEIRVRGDRNQVTNRPVRPDDIRRFPDAYKDFQAGAEHTGQGTPLKEWPSMTKSMVEELKFFGFNTVEQLANASDSVCSKFAGLQTWKQKAKLFIEYAKEAKPLDEIQRRVEEAENNAEVLRRNNAELSAAIGRLEAQVEALQGRKGK